MYVQINVQINKCGHCTLQQYDSDDKMVDMFTKFDISETL